MTSVVELIVACPHCGLPNRHSQLAGLSYWLVRFWSDGWRDPIPPPNALYRCGVCGAAALRAQFADLGQLKMAEMAYDVDLLASGPDRVKVMQVMRRLTGADLSQALSWLQDGPSRIATGLRLDDRERLTGALGAMGAVCSIHAREIAPGSPAAWFAAPALQDADDVETLRAQLHAPGLDDEGETALRLALYQHWNAPFREASVTWLPGDQRDGAQQDNARRLASLLREHDDYERLLKANLARERSDHASASILLTGDFGDYEPLAARLRLLVETKQSAVAVFGPSDFE